jgi:tetratricopeptide (TPR) repeat protein
VELAGLQRIASPPSLNDVGAIVTLGGVPSRTGLRGLLAVALLVVAACAGSSPDARDLSAEGRYAEARDVLREVEDLTAEQAVQLGEACVETGDLDDAERAFRLARSRHGINPDLVYRALFGLGNVGMLRWDGNEALAFFGEAREVAFDSGQRASAELGMTYARELLGEGEPPAAESPRTVRAPLGTTSRSLPARPRPLPERAPETAPAPAPSLTILSRSLWRARPLRQDDAVAMGRITRITVHHTGEGTPPGPASRATDAERMRNYQAFHVGERGWADIGYHFVIDPSGRIWEGREIRWQGAHAGNDASNRGNIGVSLMGNFEHGPLNSAQRASLERLVRHLLSTYRVRRGELWTHQAIKLEYDLPGTACPGRHLRAYVAELDRTLAADFAALSPASGGGAADAGRRPSRENGAPCHCCVGDD